MVYLRIQLNYIRGFLNSIPEAVSTSEINDVPLISYQSAVY